MTADNKQQTAADGRTLVIAAAGTGGHVMPGLAVARVMADRGWKIVWIGTTTGMEKGLVERQGIEFHPLNFQGMRGRGIITHLSTSHHSRTSSSVQQNGQRLCRTL